MPKVELSPPDGSAFERVDFPRVHLPMDAHGSVQIPLEGREAMLAKRSGALLAELFDGELRVLLPKGAIPVRQLPQL